MILNDIANMENYLQNDCYCPGEIYDVSGFFFQVFSKDDECTKLGETTKEDKKVIGVACKNQIINFWIKDSKIVSAERYDATENNIELVKLYLSNQNIKDMQIDEFEKGSTEKSLDEILKFADAIMIN